jgi:hypothetical protein
MREGKKMEDKGGDNEGSVTNFSEGCFGGTVEDKWNTETTRRRVEHGDEE